MKRPLKSTLIFIIGLIIASFIIYIVFPWKKDNRRREPEPEELYISQEVDVFGNPIGEFKYSEKPAQKKETAEAGELQVHFIDVGQADCILLQMPDGQDILIDGGNNADGDDVVDYLRSLEVAHLDAIIATHPHEDHIGGLDDIMEGVPTDVVYMPDIPAKDKPGTKTFEDFLSVIEEQAVPVIYPKNGDYIYQNNQTSLQVISPNQVPEGNLNDYSIVTKLVHDEVSMMFTGDAEDIVNQEMMKQYDKDFLHVNVLKAGHHGSRTSMTREWADTVNPDYCIIMCEEGNSYGHPHKETLEYLNGKTIYRTDTNGTIICWSDGEQIQFSTQR